MKKNMQILIIMMIAAVCSAQNQSSVEQIMQELKVASPAASVAPVAEAVNAAPLSSAAPIAEVPLAAADVEALVAESMCQYAEGNTPAAEKGFGKILRSKPDHAVARYFQSRIDSKKIRNTEEKAMDRVNQVWNGMILRNYPLTDEAIENLSLTTAEQGMDVSGLFSPIAFTDGAYAMYWPNVKKIMMLNTPDRLLEMEKMLVIMEQPASEKEGQIEIKTRFMEFSEGALEELGFNWQNLENQKIAGDWSVNAGENLFSDSLRTSSDVFTKNGNLPDPSLAAFAGGSTAGDWKASRLTDNFNDAAGELRITGDIGPKVEMLIRALDQSSGADVLSAPSVVTRAGQKASIQVGQTHYFPENFGVGGNEGTITHVDYQGFSEKLMGVDLSVNPKLVKDNLIEMDLNPKVTELLGWRNYQIAPANSAYTFYQYRIGNTYEHDPIVARLPIFRHREVKTKVTIQDGGTIGMGGLITEKTESFSDRVPVLGSIPLVGRLFRSEGERTVKRNLMIFVTASKVAPNGRILSEQTFK
jgi:type II secretory pathway component GspD/PulD (secretin)